MKSVRKIRLYAMIALIILLAFYFYRAGLPQTDLLWLRNLTLFIGCAIVFFSLLSLYFIDRTNRKETLFGMLAVILLVIVAIMFR